MFRKITLFTVFLTLIMMGLASYFRLSANALAVADQDIFTLLRSHSHLYLTGILAVMVLVLSIMAWWQKHNKLAAVVITALVLSISALEALIAYSAKAIATMPIIVATQVVLGLLVFWLLYGLYLRTHPIITKRLGDIRQGLVWLARFAQLIVFLQVVLGVWLSVNQASLVCADFPRCNGLWWPTADYATALNVLNGLFTGYTGVFAYEAQVAINWLHRLGALVSFIVLSVLLFRATAIHSLKPVKTAGLYLGILMFVELGLAIAGVRLAMPVWIAVAHHIVAALLMLPLLAISFYSRYGAAEAQQPPRPVVVRKPEVKTAPAAVAVPIAEPIAEAYVQSGPESLYIRLKSQLKRTRSGLSGIISSLPIGQKEINAALLEEIEASLIMADVGVETSADIIQNLTASVERYQLNDGLALSVALKQELLGILQPCDMPLNIPQQDTPFVILVVGVNGAGKTTTIGKLAKRLQAQGHSVMLAAGDTFRAAAVEQLQVWGERNQIPVVAQHTGADSASVIYDALQSAKAKGIDVLIADTAGRLQTKSNLMDELKKVKRIMGKLDEAAPHEVLLVLDAGTGQNALSQAKLFNETVALTGMVLTKLDGTAKGGVIFALAKQTGIPIRYIGIGEGIDDLQDFNAEQFVNALFVKD